MLPPPARCDHVGSVLRPDALRHARERQANGAITARGGCSSTVHGNTIAVQARRTRLRPVVKAPQEVRGG